MTQKIRDFRTELMGMAILWVILYHSKLQVPFLNFFINIGYGGVDVFLFLSGYGLYFSYYKNNNVLAFLKKRWLRIFPTYAFVVILSMLLLGTFTWQKYLIYISTLGFWVNRGYFEWYIPSLMALYLMFPIFYKMVHKRPIYYWGGIWLLTLSLVFFRMIWELDPILMFFIARIPIYAMGIVWAKWTLEKKQFKRGSEWVAIILSAVGIVALYLFRNYVDVSIVKGYGFQWYPFVLIVPGLCVLSGMVLEKLRFAMVRKSLFFLGTLSLELYLLHIKLFESSYDIAEYLNISRTIVLGLSFLIVIPASMAVSKLAKWVYK